MAQAGLAQNSQDPVLPVSGKSSRVQPVSLLDGLSSKSE